MVMIVHEQLMELSHGLRLQDPMAHEDFYVHHFTWAAGALKSGAPPSPQGASMAAQDLTASNHHSPASSTSRGQQISVSMASKQIREKPIRTTYDPDLGDGNHPSRTVQRGVAHSTDRPAISSARPAR
ncbi:hypothetical protein ACLOJK_034237 [Asimina triloba]